ncbi:MAG: hypothetical protein QXR92_04160 [Fervidicoccaceae archaeon]
MISWNFKWEDCVMVDIPRESQTDSFTNLKQTGTRFYRTPSSLGHSHKQISKGIYLEKLEYGWKSLWEKCDGDAEKIKKVNAGVKLRALTSGSAELVNS